MLQATANRQRAAIRRSDTAGDGYGMAAHVATSADGVPAGAFGWDGGSGTSWRVDPATDRTVIVFTQTLFTSPDPPAIHKDVWRAVFAAA